MSLFHAPGATAPPAPTATSPSTAVHVAGLSKQFGINGSSTLALDGLDQAKRDKGQKPKYYPRVQYNVGIIHFIQGNYTQALPYLRTALDMQPDASIFQTALRECREAIDLQVALRQAESRSETPARPEPQPYPKAEAQPAKSSPEERLRKLQELQDLYKKGLLDKKEYEAKKAEILKEM